MEQVGNTFLFNYGEVTIRAHYVSDTRLRWEQTEGPAPGLAAEETYHSFEVRPNVYFISWQEQGTLVVTQVVDFERRKVFTAWISPEKQVSNFEGTIEPVEMN
jgi:hypothetical protein